MIKSFVRVYPDVSLDVRQADSTTYKEKLTTGATDIAFVCGLRPNDPSIECMPLIQDCYYFALPKDLPLAKKELIEWVDIVDLPLALLTSTYQVYKTTISEFQKLGAAPNIRMTSDQLLLILDVIAENRWCSVLGEALTDEERLKYSDMVSVPMNSPNEFCMLRRRESYASQAERCFAEFLRANWPARDKKA